MRNKALALLCALMMLLVSVAVALPAQAAVGDTVYIKKHISLLYDNSGSMELPVESGPNLRWCYASYAAQIFTGLLNDTDSLSFTFMNGVGGNAGIKSLAIDLAADRQQQVNKVLNSTDYASGGTPFDSILDARDALLKAGLRSDAEIGDNQISKGEQYWLVLTTDGNFYYQNNTKVSVDEVVNRLKTLLDDYSNMQLVYFGIGTKDDQSDDAALDLRENDTLNAYPNFTAVYAEDQTEIVSTMNALANRISGRYSVTNNVQQDGNKVTIRISSETSPIRNVAVLAQNTTATLVSATSDSGVNLKVSRPAVIKYPFNKSYDNVDEGTKGGSTALIVNPDGKLPPGTITLEFSEPVSMDDLSLMFEPAICVNLTLQRKDASGEWVDVPYGEKVLAEQELRVNYVICEDGTDTPIDPAKLPGVTTAQISNGNQAIEVGKSFQLPVGASTITATVSMMDGNYVVSTSRNVTAQSLSAYTYEVSPALEFYPDDLATNSSQYIDFKIFHQGSLATADQLTGFKIDAGDLKGLFTTPSAGVYRFTPKDDARPVGEYTVALMFQNHVVATQTVRVKAEELSYSAVAGDALALYTNETADNQIPVIFTVTKHLGDTNSLLVESEMGDFRVEAVAADGTALKGEVKYQANGQIHFIVKDDVAVAGEYAVNLYWKDTKLASGQISVLQYNAVYTAEVFPIGDGTVDRFHLMENENGLAFVVYADGEALTTNQLQAMLNQQKIVIKHSPKSGVLTVELSVGEYNGTPAVLAIPTTKTKSSFCYAEQKLSIAVFGAIKKGPLDITMDVQAVYGTSVSGSLDVTNDFMDWLICLIIFIAIAVIVMLAVWIGYCNLLMPRIAPGKFRRITITMGPGGVSRAIGPLMKHERPIYVQFTLAPEKIAVEGGKTFFADRLVKGRTSAPRFRVKSDDPKRLSYYSLDADNVTRLMTASPLTQNIVSGAMRCAVQIAQPGDDDTVVQVDSGNAIVQKTVFGDTTKWYVWVYTRN